MIDYAMTVMLWAVCGLGLIALATVALLKAFTILPDPLVAGTAIALMAFTAWVAVVNNKPKEN